MNDNENQNMCEVENTQVQAFDFGGAIRFLKQGYKVARLCWKNDFIWLKTKVSIKSEWCKDGNLKAIADKNGGEIEGLDTFSYYGEGKEKPFILTGWTPLPSDILSQDWVIVGEVPAPYLLACDNNA